MSSRVVDGGPQLWGTFSPADHLRDRAFVADVLIYDRMIVPVPSMTPDDALSKKWMRKWDPKRQTKLLDVIKAADPHLLITVPWDEAQQHAWEASNVERGPVGHREEAPQHLLLADKVRRDVDEVQMVRAANPDSPEQYSERIFLRDLHKRKRDRALAKSVPTGDVQVVAAYGSESEFVKDLAVEPAADDFPAEQLLGAFAWPLLVPSSSRRNDIDLLKEAVDLATDERIREYRIDYRRWLGQLFLEGASAAQAAAELEQMIADYASAVKRTRIKTAIRIACVVLGGAAGGVIASLAVGPLGAGIGGATGAGLDQMFGAWKLKPLTENAAPAALFHEARKRFGGWS